jgi:hypothetical protein
MLMAAFPARADWHPVTRTAAFVGYSDASTVHRSGGRVQIWEMKDYRLPQPTSSGRPYLSSKILSEYDCANQQTRFLSLAFYSENRGYGDVVSVYEQSFPWSVVAPGTIARHFLDFACRGG